MIKYLLKNRVLLLIILLLSINLLIFSNIFGSYFYADDLMQYWDQSFNSLPELYEKTIYMSVAHLFRPIHYLFLSLNSKLFYINTSLCYLTLFLAHFFASLTVYYFFLNISRNENYAFMGSLLFLVYMSSWEVLGWSVLIYYPLVVIFMLNSFIAFNNKKYGLSAILYALALLTHEVAILFLPLLIGYKYIVEEQKLKLDNLKEYYLPGILSIIYIIIYYFTHKSGGVADYKVGLHFFSKELEHISSAFVPFVFHYRRIHQMVPYWFIKLISILKIVVLIVIPFGLIYSIKRKIKLVPYFLLWIALTMAPFAFFMGPTGSRYLYVATIGAVAIYVYILKKMIDNKRFKNIGIAIFIIVLLVNLVGIIVPQKLLYNKKEIRRTIMNDIVAENIQFTKNDKIAFIDAPLLENEMKKLFYLYRKSDQYDITIINPDNIWGEITETIIVKKAQEKNKYVFQYDFSSKKLRLLN